MSVCFLKDQEMAHLRENTHGTGGEPSTCHFNTQSLQIANLGSVLEAVDLFKGVIPSFSPSEPCFILFSSSEAGHTDQRKKWPKVVRTESFYRRKFWTYVINDLN